MSLVLSLALALSSAHAHKPYFARGADHAAPDDAFVVEDTDVSIVVYDERTCPEGQLWLTFDGEAGQELFVQLGMPAIDRLADQRPSLAVFAPGLPELELDGVQAPEDLGGQVWERTPADEPSDFFEEFTQTENWIWVEETLTLPESGTGYIVAWDPDGWTGKQWVAVGTREDFSGGFDFSLAELYTYYEAYGYEPDEAVQEQVCTEEGVPEGEAQGAADGVGCAVGSGRAAGVLGLVGLLAVAGRRRAFHDHVPVRGD